MAGQMWPTGKPQVYKPSSQKGKAHPHPYTCPFLAMEDSSGLWIQGSF